MAITTIENYLDSEGNPAGGVAIGTGFQIAWQNGPLRKPIVPSVTYGDGSPVLESQQPNGAFVEDLLRVCLRRLEFYNGTKFRCRQNSLAITHIEEALHWLADRTADRVERGVEGTTSL